MVRKIILLALLFTSVNLSYCQKYMVKNNGLDTLPYKESINVYTDTINVNGKAYLPGDTSFFHPCNSFEIVSNKIQNRRTDRCDSVGLWVLTNEEGSTFTGQYSSFGHKTGTWIFFDKEGKMTDEYVYVRGEVLAHYQYLNGKKIAIFEDPWIKRIYQKYAVPFWVVFAVLFFSRVFVNSVIYNSENGTNYSVFYFTIGPIVTNTNNFYHSIKCTYKFWWNLNKLKRENVAYAKFINICTVLFVFTLAPIIILGNLGYLS